MKTYVTEMRGESCALLRMPVTFDDETRRGDLAHSSNIGTGAMEPRITYVSRAIIREHLRANCALRLKNEINEDVFSKKMRAHWMRGGQLPAQLQAKILDHDLEYKLNAVPLGYQRVVVGSDVLLIEIATRRIVDIMRNIYAG